MKKISSVLTLLLVFVLLCSLFAGCAANNASEAQSNKPAESSSAQTAAADTNKKFVVGVILNHLQDIFMKNLEKGCIEEAKNYPNLEMKLVESGMDPAKQLSQVEQFISEKVNLIVLNPTNQMRLLLRLTKR